MGEGGESEPQIATLSNCCTYCDIVKNKPHHCVYKDDLCAIILARKQMAKLHYECIPLRHIRDVNQLRPIMSDPKSFEKMVRKNEDDIIDINHHILVNDDNQKADIELLKHMVKV